MPEDYIFDNYDYNYNYDEISEPIPPPADKRRKFDKATRGPAILRPPNDQRVEATRILPIDAADALMEGVPTTVRDALGEHGINVLRKYLCDSDMDYSYFSKYFSDVASKDKARTFLEPGLRAWTAPVLSAIAPGFDTPSIQK